MTETDIITPRLVAEFGATFAGLVFAQGRDIAPLGLHWCLAPPLADTASLGTDGHPQRLHPVSVVDFPRRMWIGGSLDITAPLRIGQTVTRASTPAPVVAKSGGSGDWCLSGADHVFTADGQALLTEHQDIAFRPAATAVAPPPAVTPLPAGDMVWEVSTPETLLFRYSALTFNSHRIHYDAPYATTVEGYRGLVVHGPLQATLLLNLVATLMGGAPRHFAYRATAPLIAGDGLVAIARRDGDGITASVHTPSGVETLRAKAR